MCDTCETGANRDRYREARGEEYANPSNYNAAESALAKFSQSFDKWGDVIAPRPPPRPSVHCSTPEEFEFLQYRGDVCCLRVAKLSRVSHLNSFINRCR
ncbi:hypothetical protein CDAR_598381 [Caerostris darwini]|uniref:Uncharacterized protein n=1 Tax=Caerostris darwini TaxID=1538125 RepID=A0AAV4QJL7_9ARAC|nr:hypothetical protein CDAR_598381 [Caerostris darwini]